MSIRQSLAFSFLDRYASLVLAIGSTMVLARLLTPTEMGLFSITMVLVSFATMIRDLGAGQYLVQERELTNDRIRAVWTVQLGAGLCLGLLTALAAWPISRFYGEPGMQPIFWVLALGFVLTPFGSITYAWLTRTMRYDAMAVMRFASSLAGAIVSVGLAWYGAGPISMAWGSLAATCTGALVSMRFRPREFPWLPGTRELPRVLSFGTKLTSTSLVETATAGAPELLLGKIQSITSAGLFARANTLIAMFSRMVSDAVNIVALSMFAKASREGGDLARAYLTANAYMLAVGWSFSAFVGCMAYPLMRVLYGDQWDAAVDLTRVLALWLAATAPAALCYQVLLASGAANVLLRSVVISGVLTVVGAAIGAWYGILATGSLMVVAAAMGTVVWLTSTRGVIHFRWADYLAGLWRSAGVAGCASLAPALMVLIVGPRPASGLLWILMAAAIGSGLGFVLGVRLFSHPISAEVDRVMAALRARLRRLPA